MMLYFKSYDGMIFVFWKLHILKTWFLTSKTNVNNRLIKQIPKNTKSFGVEFSFKLEICFFCMGYVSIHRIRLWRSSSSEVESGRARALFVWPGDIPKKDTLKKTSIASERFGLQTNMTTL